MASVICPTGFPKAPEGLRSGLPPRSHIPMQLAQQVLFEHAAFKNSYSFSVADDYSAGITYSSAGSADPLLLRMYIPPFTQWLAWRVYVAGQGGVIAQRTGSARYMKIVTDDTPGGQSYGNGDWFFAWGVTSSGDGEAVCIDIDNNTDEWVMKEVKVWLDTSYSTRKAELFTVEFQPIRLTNIGSDTIPT